MSFFDYLQTFSTNTWIYGGSFILILSILVFVHEWGHYIIARLCGVRVEVFSIGFGRELFGINDRHGTRWKFSLVPLGGYVKLYGDVDPASSQHDDQVEDVQTGQKRTMTEQERSEAFFTKPVWKRAAIVFAGPAINYLFAIILMMGLFSIYGKPVTPPVGAAVMQDSAAAKAGFQPLDRVVAIDGQPVRSFEDIRMEMMISLDQDKEFLVERNGEEITIQASPEMVEQEDRFGFKHSRGLLGLISPRHAIRIDNIATIDGTAYDSTEEIRAALLERMGQTINITVQRGQKTDALIITPFLEMNEALQNPEEAGRESEILFIGDAGNQAIVRFGILESFGEAVKQSYVITAGTLEALGQMIMGTRSATELGGVIRIGAIAGDMAQQGLIALIMFTALLSINLGLINLFPVPMLDGGHLVFYAFEALLGRPIPDHIQEYAFRFGLFFLVFLMVFTNINDIVQLVQ